MDRPSVLIATPFAIGAFGFAVWKGGGYLNAAIGLWCFAFLLLLADVGSLLWKGHKRRTTTDSAAPAVTLLVDLRRCVGFRFVSRETDASNDFAKRLAVVCEARSRMPRAVRCELRVIELQIHERNSWETPGWFKPVRLIWTTDTFDTVIQPGGSAECDLVRRNLYHGRWANIWTRDFDPSVINIPSGSYRVRLSLDGLGCRSKVAEQRFRWEEPEGLGRIRGSLEWSNGRST